MPCDVYLYDSSCTPLPDPAIQIYPARSAGGRNLTRHVNNAQIGRKWGAQLGFSLQQIVYTVTAHDPNGTYAPVHLTNLNGGEPGTLDIVMFPQPRSGSQTGSPPQTASLIAAYIARQAWTADQKTGVRHLVRAVGDVRGTPDPLLHDFLLLWEHWLFGLGIDPTLV